MELHKFEQEFNKIWNKADFKRKQQILRELDKIINRKETEKQAIKAFFHAVKNEKVTAVRNILKQGIDVNLKDDVLGNTALSYAVYDSNFDLIQLLLHHRADPYIKNNRGYNSIDAAELIGNEKIIKLVTNS